jgi:hypothetical protein
MIYILIILTAICGILIAYIIHNNKHSLKIYPSNYINPNDTILEDYDIFGPPGYNVDTDKIEILIKKHTKYPITVHVEQNYEGILVFEITDTFSEN